MQAAGGIKRLTASVSIAAQVQGTGDARKVVPRTPEELEKLRSVVASAVGIDTTRGDTIALEELPFNNDFATEVTHELDQQQKQDFWWDLARNATYPALAMVVFVILLRLLKPHAGAGNSARRSRRAADGTHNGNGNGNGNGHGNGTANSGIRMMRRPAW